MKNVINEGKEILRNPHTEVFCAMHAVDSSNTMDAEVDTQPNLDLMPSAGNVMVMCGAPLIGTVTTTTLVASHHDQANEVLKKRHKHTVNWIRAVVQQVSNDKRTAEVFTTLLQERVFSAGAFVMSALRTSTDNYQAEMQMLLKHNRS
ncbi:hypothetical protein L914_15402 [Phytophthora nicotianae]|nr:hypothetical protein L914_15402 [Phytophthora nicotianae]